MALHPSGDRQFVTALARGLDILAAFDPGDRWLGNQEIAARTNLAKPTVSRLTYTLTRLGYLNYDPESSKYSVGVRVLALAQPLVRGVELRNLVRPLLQELADQVDAAVALGTADGLDACYLEVCRGAEAVTLRFNPGSRLFLPTSAMGGALFAAMPESRRDEIVAAIRSQYRRRAGVLVAALRQAADEVAQRGFCVAAGRLTPTVNGVGVPLKVFRGDMVFALNCGGAAWTMPVERLESEIGPKLVGLSERIASRPTSLG